MFFPLEDFYWVEVRTFLEKYSEANQAILAPNEFLEFFPGNYPYEITSLLPVDRFAFVVFHKGMVSEIAPAFAQVVLQLFCPVFANEVFVVYAPQLPSGLEPPANEHIQPLLEQCVSEDQQEIEAVSQKCAIAVTTHNHPENLARSLPQLMALGVPIVIVDDASSPELALENQRIADQYHALLLRLPENRGLPNAINIGINYWLADPNIQWISYFRDDVDVHPETLAVLAKIQHPNDRPLLSGRDALEHPSIRSEAIAGYPVLLKRSTTSQHLHAHRDYWNAVLPVPTPYLGAPKPDREKSEGADEDWWITAWSPRSIVKQGGYVVCVPGLVKPFEWTIEPTWEDIKVAETESPAISKVAPAKIFAGAIAPPVLSEPTKQPEPAAQLNPSESEILPFPEMSLSQVSVLVDGYNLQLTSGTGIKTYGTSLVKALHLMGAKVDVLFSRSGFKNNKILDEVIFFDNQERSQDRLQDLITVAKGLIKTAAGPLFAAKRRQSLGDFVVKQGKYSEDFLEYAKSFNLPQCYSTASALYRYLNLTSQIHLSEKVDLWHATYPIPVKVSGAKKITTIHDLIPLRLPYATLDDKENFYNNVRDALKDSAVTIAVSEYSKQDILAFFDVDPDKIVVTYQPIALEPLEATAEEVAAFLKRYRLESGRYILFVGAIEPKKNLGRLLDAYSLIETDMPLVVVGKKGWLWEDEIGKAQSLFDKESTQQVKMLEYVTTKSLRYLYRGAYCLVFPSLYEGFGLPPIEAMTFGCPVITSQASCLPEICGDAALYVDPYEVSDIQQKLEQLLGDGELRDRLIESGKQNAALYSMENYITRLYKAYTKALQ